MEYKIHVAVNNIEQLKTVLDSKYSFERIYVSPTLALNSIDFLKEHEKNTFYLCSPYILREKDYEIFKRLLDCDCFKGVLVRNLEAFSLLNSDFEKYKEKEIILDCGMYILNKSALRFYKENTNFIINEMYCSYELSSYEQQDLGESEIIKSNVIYGKVPMMQSANCVRKTMDKCTKNPGFFEIEDRKHKRLPVYCDCTFCLNTIYNPVPVSLHKFFGNLIKKGNVRIDFTNENESDTRKTVDYFVSLFNGFDTGIPYSEYTSGHYNKGIL